LKPNGRLEGKFAQKAVALLPAWVHVAVLGSEGSILTVGGGVALRILANGKLAPGFGPSGLTVPVSEIEEGAELIGLTRQDNRKAMVLDLGTRFCRQGGSRRNRSWSGFSKDRRRSSGNRT